MKQEVDLFGMRLLDVAIIHVVHLQDKCSGCNAAVLVNKTLGTTLLFKIINLRKEFRDPYLR